MGEKVSKFTDLVEAELLKARAKFPTGMHGPHESYAVILEELDEFWDEVRSQNHYPGKMLKELVQVAAMCARAAEDCGFVEE